MKIAMLTNNYKPFVGGVPISVERQAEELVKLGNEVTVFAPEYIEGGAVSENVNISKTELTTFISDILVHQEKMEETGEQVHNVRVIRYGVCRTRMENGMVYPKWIQPEILQVFETEKFDLIHTHHPMFVGLTALYLGRKYQLPVVYTYHTRYEEYLHYVGLFQENRSFPALRKRLMKAGQRKVIPAYMRWFTNQCDLVLAPTAGMQRRIRENGTSVPMAVFPTGLADEFYQERQKEAAYIRRKYLQDGGYLFCTTGRLEEEKNPHFLLKGICKLKERMTEPFRVLLLGDGSMRKELEIEAQQLGISEIVQFVGNIENEQLNRYLQACDVFLFASKSETQGIVLAEALASGCPVVAVRASGVEDLVKNGVNGFLTEEEETVWAEKVIEAAHLGMKEQARRSAYAYRASGLAIYEEMLYIQCVAAKERKEREDEEYEPNRKKHATEVISGIFKAS